MCHLFLHKNLSKPSREFKIFGELGNLLSRDDINYPSMFQLGCYF